MENGCPVVWENYTLSTVTGKQNAVDMDITEEFMDTLKRPGQRLWIN